MSDSDPRIVIDNRFTARSLSELLDRRGTERGILRRLPGSSPGSTEEALPLSSNGKLAPLILYASTTDPAVRYYLPLYRLAVDDGRYATRLKWRSPQDDPDGPLAWLTVELQPEAPSAPGLKLIEIDHTTVAQLVYVLPAQGAQNGAQLSIELGALERQADQRSRCVKPIFDKQEFDRLYQILTDSALQARLELRCTAMVGYRTWRQIMLPSAVRELPGNHRLLHEEILDRKRLPALDPAPRIDPVRRLPPTVVRPTAERPAASLRPSSLVRVSPALATRSQPPIRLPVLAHPVLRPEPQPAETPAAPEAPAHAELPVREAWKRAAGLETLLDRRGRPTVLRVQATAVQSIAPFCFPIATNAYMFDLPGDLRPSTNHILIPRTVIGGDGLPVATFYQDSAFRDQFYYQPQEFRLSRLSAAPGLPDLLVAFLDAVGKQSENDDDVVIYYRAELAFHAAPYLSPQILDLARVQLAELSVPPRFTALNPAGSTLRLRLPLDESDGQLRDIERPGATINFTEAVSDNLDLSSTELERLLAAFESPSGIGIEGAVRAQLLDGRSIDIPLRLSLRETAGSLFDATFLGPVAGAPQGRHRVSLRNRIESAVELRAIAAVQVAPGVMAAPLSPVLPLVVRPGETIQIEYAAPPQAVVTAIEPVLSAVAQVEPHFLWRMLMVNRGYTSNTFTIQVAIDPGYFGPPPSEKQELLTGVLVEFEADTEVTLTAQRPSAEVVLRMPILDRLLKEPTAQGYRYRVTNLHVSGEGARTNWQASEGDLQLAPAPLGGA